MNGPLFILATYLVMSLVAFVAYGLDKRAATRGRSRIPESTLHLLALAGGFPGAWIGQRAFRHKRRKVPFMVVFWLIVLVHAASWGLWAWWKWS